MELLAKLDPDHSTIRTKGTSMIDQLRALHQDQVWLCSSIRLTLVVQVARVEARDEVKDWSGLLEVWMKRNHTKQVGSLTEPEEMGMMYVCLQMVLTVLTFDLLERFVAATLPVTIMVCLASRFKTVKELFIIQVSD